MIIERNSANCTPYGKLSMGSMVWLKITGKRLNGDQGVVASLVLSRQIIFFLKELHVTLVIWASMPPMLSMPTSTGDAPLVAVND